MKKTDLKIKIKIFRQYPKRKWEIKTIYLATLPHSDTFLILKNEILLITKIYLLCEPDKEGHVAKIVASVFQMVDSKGKVDKCKLEKVLGF